MKKMISTGIAVGMLLGGLSSASASELVTNGDFSAGNAGFTTGYIYSFPMYFYPGYYSISNSVTNNNGTSFYDHTTATSDGQMMIVDGAFAATPLKTVWQETFSVTTNTNYELEAWARAITKIYGAPVITLGFVVNGVELGTLSLENPDNDYWQEYSVSWNSGTNTSATLTIIDYQTNNSIPGNDFAVDDISFAHKTNTVPVPSTLTLLGVGLASLAANRVRRR